jgi:hypothetical protein
VQGRAVPFIGARQGEAVPGTAWTAGGGVLAGLGPRRLGLWPVAGWALCRPAGWAGTEGNGSGLRALPNRQG